MVPKWGPSCGHENGSTVEPFQLHFFLLVFIYFELGLVCPSMSYAPEHLQSGIEAVGNFLSGSSGLPWTAFSQPDFYNELLNRSRGSSWKAKHESPGVEYFSLSQTRFSSCELPWNSFPSYYTDTQAETQTLNLQEYQTHLINV